MVRLVLKLSALLLLLVVTTAACGTVQTKAAKGPTPFLRVVTSIFPLADVVHQVGGERVEVVSLLPAGASVHNYEPSTADVKRLAGADLVFLVGLGLDKFAQKLAEAQTVNMVIITEGLNLLPVPELLLSGHGEDHSDDHGLLEPHIWLDPVLVRDEIAPRVAEAMIEADPAGAEYYNQNLHEFEQQLTDLDREIRDVTAGFSQKSFIVFHSAWHYFAQRYGLDDINVEEFPNQEPSARELAEIVEIGRRTGSDAIFVEPQFSPRAAQVIAAEYNAAVLTIDPLGGPGIEGRDSYLGLIRWNLAQFEKGLR